MIAPVDLSDMASGGAVLCSLRLLLHSTTCSKPEEQLMTKANENHKKGQITAVMCMAWIDLRRFSIAQKENGPQR
ncbi:hypothetical protein T11_18373 [Trichinella zimbabwensis]|uniref:Uncharacterized protein n=1 Tax=Trichinella zimbabwensis TaxID=268475 RepID=A0A0V1HIM7_9BILA|nr:hypothetical protein T11_18373 [Trichinella zimbabwensis]